MFSAFGLLLVCLRLLQPRRKTPTGRRTSLAQTTVHFYGEKTQKSPLSHPIGSRRLCSEFTLESITLQTHRVIVVMDHFTREMIGIGVSQGPSHGEDIC